MAAGEGPGPSLQRSAAVLGWAATGGHRKPDRWAGGAAAEWHRSPDGG